MTRRTRIWQVVAWLTVIVNLAGAFWAARLAENAHAGVHVVLLLGGLLWTWWLANGGGRNRPGADTGASAPAGRLAERMANLEQSIDAVALEVERIGEGQRFVTRLLDERGAPQAAGPGGEAPPEAKAVTPPG